METRHNGPEHIPRDELERYVLDRLPQANAVRLEEHLLICERCREQLETITVLVRAVREELA